MYIEARVDDLVSRENVRQNGRMLVDRTCVALGDKTKHRKTGTISLHGIQTPYTFGISP